VGLEASQVTDLWTYSCVLQVGQGVPSVQQVDQSTEC
jgi:hypothetical protein